MDYIFDDHVCHATTKTSKMNLFVTYKYNHSFIKKAYLPCVVVVHVPAGGRSQAGVPDGGPGAGRAWREEAQPAHRRLGVGDTKERVHLI